MPIEPIVELIKQPWVALALGTALFCGGYLLAFLLSRAKLAKVEVRWQQECVRREAAETALVGVDGRMERQMQEVASAALQKNTDHFLKVADSLLQNQTRQNTADLDHRQHRINDLVKGMEKSLHKVDSRLEDIEKERVRSQEGLFSHIKQLGDAHQSLVSQTHNLSKALRSSSVRGRWGELQLKRIVELAGMTAHCDFYEQQTAGSDAAKFRPDMVVKLPGDRQIVIDAKAPLEAYIKSTETDDLDLQNSLLIEHAGQIRRQLQALSQKRYFEQFEQSPDFVVLFLPGEAFLSAAIQKDPSLLEWGVEQKVILATPTTLIGLLKAVSYGWRQEKWSQQTREIAAVGQEMYKRFRLLGKYVVDVGQNLNRTVGSYNKFVNSMESRVLSSLRKMNSFEVLSDEKDSVETLNEVDADAKVHLSQEMLEDS